VAWKGCATDHTLAGIPHVGGRRPTSFEPGGAKMEPDRFWLLLLIGVAVLIVVIMLDGTH
jgi:hypothetical protein